MGITVLSLFDGISCGMVALERAGIEVDKYIAYEIEHNAIEISKKNYPEIVRGGDVTKEEKARRWYFIKQKAYGFVMLAVTVLAVWATEGDITIAVITVPLGLMCLFGKKMLIVDNYYFEAKKG